MRRSHTQLPDRRIISLSPALTDFLVAIGATPQLVGVSDYCDLPEGCQVERIGGISNPNIERIYALAPDAILIDRSPGSGAVASQSLGDLPTHSVIIRSVASSIDQLAELAYELDYSDAAADLITQLRQAVDRGYDERARYRLQRIVTFTWRDPWVAIGGESYADDLLRLCGAENIALRLAGRNPRAGLEVFMRSNPQIILLAYGTYPFEPADADSFWRFGDVDAVRSGQIALCDARWLQRYGPRMLLAIPGLMGLLHR
jgi:ABC-type Fe3+-hydroxamate transport system substrate-binding protein